MTKFEANPVLQALGSDSESPPRQNTMGDLRSLFRPFREKKLSIKCGEELQNDGALFVGWRTRTADDTIAAKRETTPRQLALRRIHEMSQRPTRMQLWNLGKERGGLDGVDFVELISLTIWLNLSRLVVIDVAISCCLYSQRDGRKGSR